MKKLLAFFLAIMAVLSVTAMFTLVGATGHDANNIAYIDFLDFSEENNKWDERDDNGNLVNTSFSSEDLIDGKYYPHAIYLEDNSFNKNLDYKFMQNGEVLRLTATDTANPGIAFDFDRLGTYGIGTEDKGYTEYVKIRFKNNSPSTKLTFMGTNQSWGAGKLDQRIRGTIDVEANSSEWQTITVSMVDLTLNTTGSVAWSSTLKQFAIFPFGYGNDNEAIVNPDYYVDIDYVVIGSKAFVTEYQSELERKEGKAIGFEEVTAPSKNEYMLGEAIDLKDFTASIKFEEDSYPDEIVGGESVSAYAKNNFEKPLDTPDAESWEETIIIKYGSHQLSYKVTVYDIKELKFVFPEDKTEIEYFNQPYDKIQILRNGRFLPEDLAVEVVYTKLKDDGVTYESSKKTMLEVELLGTDFATEVELSEDGYYEYLVTVQYRGHTLYLPVKLIDIAEILVTPVEDKTSAIYYGTAVDTSFFDVVCKYTNGTEKSLADTGLASYLSVSCATKTTGGDTIAKLELVNNAYEVNVAKDVTLTVQTPVDIAVTLKTSNYDVDEVITPNRFSIKYTYANGTTATVDQDDPNLVFNYDTSAPGENLTGVVKIGDKKASFTFNVDAAKFDSEIQPVDRAGAKVTLLKPKFPTFWLVTIIVCGVIVFFVALWALLKFVFKVNFKRKKRVSLDDIF